MTTEYLYGGRDLFAEPENYEYAKCDVPDYLNAWREQRAAFAERMVRDGTVARSAGPEVVPDVDGQFVLASVLADLKSERLPPGLQFKSAKSVLDSLVAKFEIYRRLFTRYDATLRRVDGAASARISDYILFGHVLAEFAANGPQPKYLSTLLKLVDALVSVEQSTEWASVQTEMSELLHLEHSLVASWEEQCQ